MTHLLLALAAVVLPAVATAMATAARAARCATLVVGDRNTCERGE